MKILKDKIQASFVILSSIILILQILFSSMFASQKNITFILFIPLLLLCIIYRTGNSITKDNEILQFVSILSSICVVLFLQLGVCTAIILTNFVSSSTEINKDISNINEYTGTIQNIYSKMTKHFPSQIPNIAKNVRFYVVEQLILVEELFI